jgi:hypothetical protein
VYSKVVELAPDCKGKVLDSAKRFDISLLSSYFPLSILKENFFAMEVFCLY